MSQRKASVRNSRPKTKSRTKTKTTTASMAQKPARKPTPKRTQAQKEAVSGLSPLQYGVVFRPERMAYVRKKLPKEQECVFCRVARLAPSLETLCVLQSEHSMVVLNKFPYNPGHLLVLPRRHVGSIQDLSLDEWHDLNHFLRLSARTLEIVYEPQGLNIGMNHGASAGAGIPDHLHYHLIPRWSGDTNFFPLMTQTKVIVEDLAVTYSRVFEKINQVVNQLPK